MNFRDLIRKRRMIQLFTPESVANDALERIIDAGNRGPSPGFSQGVSFISITNQESRTKVGELCGEHSYIAASFGPFASRAPVQIVVCTSEAAYRARYRQPDQPKFLPTPPPLVTAESSGSRL